MEKDISNQRIILEQLLFLRMSLIIKYFYLSQILINLVLFFSFFNI